MYFNPPPQTSPALNKLAGTHHDPWGRTHHQQHQQHLLSSAAAAVAANGHAHSHAHPHQQHTHGHAHGHAVVGPPTPGYSMYAATNGGTPAMHHPAAAAAAAVAAHAHGLPGHPSLSHQHAAQHAHHPHAHQHHQHQTSLSHPSFSSPPNGHASQSALAQTSPPGVLGPVMTQHWQQQLLKYDIVRAQRSPWHRARQSMMTAAKPTTRNAITITDPNRVKPLPTDAKDDGTSSDSGSGNGDERAPENHPSATTAPVAPVRKPSAESSWASLDMSGVGVKNLPRGSGLWSFTFLQNLYLNHNALQSVPPEISQLRHLELLDLSGNLLQNVPPELGMVTTLKELYLFDNHIMTLPYELGFLHQLRTLGIEGNPFDHNMKDIVQREGTQALIAFLRDTAPPPPSPAQRVWQDVRTEADRKKEDPNAETMKVLCYNILCERAATERLYGYTPKKALEWSYRKELIMDEIKSYDTDFICLQEVDVAQYGDFFLQHLSEKGYEGVYWPKSRANTMDDTQRRLVDGCATFFKSAKYQLVEKQLVEFRRVAMQRPDFKKTDDMFNRVLQRDNIAVITLFENKATGSRVIVVNAHLHWDHLERDVKLVQVALLVDEVEKSAARFARYPPPPPPPANADGEDQPPRPVPVYSDGTKIPTIICGDYNSVPDSGVYEFMSTGVVPPDHQDFMSFVYGNYTTEGLRHRMGLRSAYASIGELPMTNYTPSFQGAIDYIWYTASNMSVTHVLGEVDREYLSRAVGFPNVHFPSDHVCIVSEFKFKPPKETSTATLPPATRQSSS